jgi:hypothetical protein
MDLREDLDQARVPGEAEAFRFKVTRLCTAGSVQLLDRAGLAVQDRSEARQ